MARPKKENHIPNVADQFVFPTKMPVESVEYEADFKTIPGIRIYPYALIHITAGLAANPALVDTDAQVLGGYASNITRELCRIIGSESGIPQGVQ